eukprot:sb/3478896/
MTNSKVNDGGREEREGERGREKKKAAINKYQYILHITTRTYRALLQKREKKATSHIPPPTPRHVYINSHSTTPSFNVSNSLSPSPASGDQERYFLQD